MVLPYVGEPVAWLNSPRPQVPTISGRGAQNDDAREPPSGREDVVLLR
ncbi:hypothetical protein [Trueperella sp.]|nr:hypothetical protein [Trueperella sp.]